PVARTSAPIRPWSPGGRRRGSRGAAPPRDFFLALTTEWGNRMFPRERERVTADTESFRSALEWSWQQGDFKASLHLVVALWQIWFFGNQTGAREWLERVVDRTQHIAHPASA